MNLFLTDNLLKIDKKFGLEVVKEGDFQYGKFPKKTASRKSAQA